jgi:hypothetical protein
MHEFQVGARRFGRPDVDDGWAEPGDTENENGTTVSQVAGRKGVKLLYIYDFGDSWEHEVVVEDIIVRAIFGRLLDDLLTFARSGLASTALPG